VAVAVAEIHPLLRVRNLLRLLHLPELPEFAYQRLL
jgi:hypothetical protein